MVTSVNPNAPVSRAQNGEKATEPSLNGELTPNEIGMEFVRQYYTLMNEAPQYLYRLYSKESKFVHGNITGKHQVPIIGQENIKVEIERLNFQHVYTKIRQVDCYSTLYDLLIVLICGDISILKTPARRFAQQIVLAPQGPLKYYVVNDIFRYIDEGDDHVENEMETESSSEGPEEDISQQVQQPAHSLGGTSEGQKQLPPSHVINDQAHHPPTTIMEHPSASGDIMRTDMMTANSTEVLPLDPNVASAGMRVVAQEPGSLSSTPQLDENVMQSMGTGATGPQVPMMPGGQIHHVGQSGGESVMNSFGNVAHPDAHMQPAMHGSADSNGVVEQTSFMPQKKPQQTEELFDQASTEVQLSTSDTAGQPDESAAHFNSAENSSDVGASYQHQPVNDTGIKTWASITGAVGASPVKKPQSDSRAGNNQHAAPPQQQFQVQHASNESFGPSSHPKPPRNPGGGKNFHAHGDVNLISPPNEPRGSSDRRSGGRSSGPQFGAGHSGSQQSSSQQMNIGTFPPKSESPGAKFQGYGNSGGNQSFNRGGPPMSGSFGGPGSFQGIPDEWQIFVGNLPPDVSNEELRRRFGEFGTVIDVRISRGGAVPFGFVAFDGPAPVQKILEKTQGPDRQTLFLRNEKHRINIEEKKPRGVGGGSGGGRSGGGRFPSGGGGPSGKSSGPREGGGGSNSKFFKSGPGPSSGGGSGKGGPGGAPGNKGGAQNSNNNSNANYINNSHQMQNSFQQGSGNPGGRR